PYPSFSTIEPETQKSFAKSSNEVNAKKENHVEFVQIDAIFPNPTDGNFSITFSKPINNASIIIVDVNGKVLHRITASGSKVDFNLSNFSSGIYFVKIIEKGGSSITKKIIKN
ncbi:MAG: T9SS type A sorting domain-containing protein, partial [Ferruginibacter sp.]|nr:T9SS type A sorting domain-containing protein [Ferruginibacter sp.]